MYSNIVAAIHHFLGFVDRLQFEHWLLWFTIVDHLFRARFGLFIAFTLEVVLDFRQFFAMCFGQE